MPANEPYDACKQSMFELGERAKAASVPLGQASAAQKNDALLAAADLLIVASEQVLDANSRDIELAQAAGTAPGSIDRLRLDAGRIASMADGLRSVERLTDPVGKIIDGWVRPNGLEIRRIQVPLGVVAIIYENRPNVTADAFGLCLKSGNTAFLRGSGAALNSNMAVAEALREGAKKAGLPSDALVLVTDTSHQAAATFMALDAHIDCLIPRGGPDLIAAVRQHATVPYVIDGDGNCHIYVDESAQLDEAVEIIADAKMNRPSVCNAVESLVVHAAVAHELLGRLVQRLVGVELVGDSAACAISVEDGLSPAIAPAAEGDFSREFLGLKLSIAIVDGLDEAICHITRHGSGHSEAILTQDLLAAEQFTHRVDAAAVLVNASTRFVDGEQFGFGAEIGISTQKLHARGPMGLDQLTTAKFVVTGQGQTRG